VIDMRHLPGAELVEAGMRDLDDAAETCEGLLVAVGAPRLRELGFDVTSPWPNPEHRLYAWLSDTFGPDEAHSRYNALIRRLVSFERAAECVA